MPTSSGRSSAAGLGRCTTSGLRVTLSAVDGAAGSFYRRVEFQNATAAPCTLTGFPGISYTDAAGTQLGQPADRTGEVITTVRVPPGRVAEAALRLPDTENIAPESCRLATSARLRVYPPNETVAVEVPLTAAICTSGEVRTQIGPVHLAAVLRPGGVTPANPAGTPQAGPGSGPATGDGSCFGCVTITALNLSVGGAGVNSECLPASSAITGPWALIGAGVRDPYRVFQFAIRFVTAALGTTPENGQPCGAGYQVSVSLAPASATFQLQQTAPAVPFTVVAGNDVRIVASLHAPEGNYYVGPLTIYVTFGPP